MLTIQQLGIRFSSTALEQHRRRQNIVNATSRNIAHPKNELESFMRFISDESMLRIIQW